MNVLRTVPRAVSPTDYPGEFQYRQVLVQVLCLVEFIARIQILPMRVAESP
jgi:hypothetical protein